MEILEEEKEVDENQISFDFLNEPVVSTVKQIESFEWVSQETLVLIVKSNGFVSADFEICGKKVMDWVSLATSGCKQIFIDDPGDDAILETAKAYVADYKYVAVFYSDTPLLQKQTFLEIMNHFSMHRMNVLKLLRGYVFRSEYLETARVMLSTTVEVFNEQDFLVLNSAEEISEAFKVLNGRILNYHKANDVIMFGESTIFIDADVEIESGVIIYPNNVIKGESYIGKGVVLESGNYIIDTIVCDDAFVCQSYLEKSKVESHKVIGPFEKLVNEKV